MRQRPPPQQTRLVETLTLDTTTTRPTRPRRDVMSFIHVIACRSRACRRPLRTERIHVIILFLLLTLLRRRRDGVGTVTPFHRTTIYRKHLSRVVQRRRRSVAVHLSSDGGCGRRI